MPHILRTYYLTKAPQNAKLEQRNNEGVMMILTAFYLYKTKMKIIFQIKLSRAINGN